jgi:hypothetical protein
MMTEKEIWKKQVLIKIIAEMAIKKNRTEIMSGTDIDVLISDPENISNIAFGGLQKMVIYGEALISQQSIFADEEVLPYIMYGHADINCDNDRNSMMSIRRRAVLYDKRYVTAEYVRESCDVMTWIRLHRL